MSPTKYENMDGGNWFLYLKENADSIFSLQTIFNMNKTSNWLVLKSDSIGSEEEVIELVFIAQCKMHGLICYRKGDW